MPQRVYNNVEGHRLYDNGRVCEDVLKFSPPTISHPTSTISASGMIMDVDVPDNARLEACEISVAHNNGVNCKYLASPGKHVIEARTVRQRYNVKIGDFEHESVKFRATCVHKSTEKGAIEMGNPYGSTEKYSVLRYEEEVNGEITTLIDAMSNILKINGKDYASAVENLLK